MSIAIGALAPQHTAKALALFSEVYGHTVTPRQWIWKYHEGPRLGSINIVAQTEDGELVGHIGASVFAAQYRESTLPWAQVCDIMVHRHARGGLELAGVYPRLVQALQHALHTSFAGVMAYGFPGVRPFKLGQRLGFYQDIYRIQANAYSPSGGASPSLLWRVQACPSWDVPRIDRIWAKLAPYRYKPLITRSAAYLSWRYRDHPSNRYHLWIVQHGWQDVGWLITATQPGGASTIVDALLPPKTNIDVLCALLWRQLGKTWPSPTSISHWLPGSAQAALPAPIVATEFRVRDWHTPNQLPPPQFQPGDTDVF